MSTQARRQTRRGWNPQGKPPIVHNTRVRAAKYMQRHGLLTIFPGMSYQTSGFAPTIFWYDEPKVWKP